MLKKKPLPEDFIKMFHSTSIYYAVIGEELGVDLADFVEMSPYVPSINKLYLVFRKWEDSNINVTWEKVLEVCKEYPIRLHNAKANLIQFLSNAEADNNQISSEEERLIQINKEQLKKEPLPEDFIRIVHSSKASSHYVIMGVGLGVDVRDLMQQNIQIVNKLILVFLNWRDSNNNVTWGKILKVCEDYPSELGIVRDNIIQFLSSEEKQISHNSMADKELLKKKPLLKDFIKIIHSSSHQASFHYVIIGVGLNVTVRDIMSSNNNDTANNLRLVFKRWEASNNNVTWGKMLKVCEDYPSELNKTKEELINFLSSEQARKYLQTPDAGEPIHIEVPDPIAREEHPILAQNNVEGSHTMLYSLYVWSEGIVPILIAVLAVIIIFIAFIYNLRRNN